MHAPHFRRWVMFLPFLFASAVGSTAQEAATVESAVKAVDLSTFPLIPGAVVGGPRRTAMLKYTAPGSVREAFAFQKEALEQAGWVEQPASELGDQTCVGVFGKHGFRIAVTTMKTGDRIDVTLQNLGDVDVSRLPVPAGARPLYAFPASAAFSTDANASETAAALKALLKDHGWEPYGEAGDVQFYRKNAVRLSARSTASPAPRGGTMIQFSSELMSAEIPAPPNPLSASYADSTKTLAFEVEATADALAAFYVQTLGATGWKPTTDGPVHDGPKSFLILRNGAKDLALLEMRTVGDRLRATLTHRTAAEEAALASRAEAALADRKIETRRRADMAAADRVSIPVTIPPEARDVTYDRGGVTFKLPAGRATAVVESIRGEMLKAGWKGEARLTPLAGALTLTRKTGVVATLVYTDPGFDDASITITAVGAEVVKPSTK